MRGLLLALALFGGSAAAADTVVPTALQSTLLLKVAAYDRANPDRTSPVLIVERADDPPSQRIAEQIEAGLKKAPTPPSSVEILASGDPAAIAARADALGAHIVYLAAPLTPGEAAALGEALRGRGVLTVAADPATVPDGVVLAFDLVSGQTKIVVNLAQARVQGVDFDSALLGIAKVIQ